MTDDATTQRPSPIEVVHLTQLVVSFGISGGDYEIEDTWECGPCRDGVLFGETSRSSYTVRSGYAIDLSDPDLLQFADHWTLELIDKLGTRAICPRCLTKTRIDSIRFDAAGKAGPLPWPSKGECDDKET